MAPRASRNSQSLTTETEMLPSFSATSKNEVAAGGVGTSAFHESFRLDSSKIQKDSERQHRRRKSTTSADAPQESARSKTPEGKRGAYFPANTPRTPLNKTSGKAKASLIRGSPGGDIKAKARKPRKDVSASMKDDSELSAASMKERTRDSPSSGENLRAVKSGKETRRRSSKTVEGIKAFMTDESLQDEKGPNDEKNSREANDGILSDSKAEYIKERDSLVMNQSTLKSSTPSSQKSTRNISSSGKKVKEGNKTISVGSTQEYRSPVHGVQGSNSPRIEQQTLQASTPSSQKPIRNRALTGKERSTDQKKLQGGNEALPDGSARGHGSAVHGKQNVSPKPARESPSTRKSIRSTGKGSDSPAPTISVDVHGTRSSTRPTKGKQHSFPRLPIDDNDEQTAVTGNDGLASKTPAITPPGTRSSIRSMKGKSDSNPKLPADSPSSRTRIRSSKSKDSPIPKLSVVDNKSRVDGAISPESRTSSVRRKLKKTGESNRSLKSPPAASPTTPVIYFPKNVPRQSRRWSATDRATEENDNDSIGRRQTNIDAIATPRTSRALNGAGNRKSNSRSGTGTGDINKKSHRRSSSSGGRGRSTQRSGNILPGKVPFPDSSNTDLDLEVSPTSPPAHLSDKEKRRKSSKRSGKSEQREGRHERTHRSRSTSADSRSSRRRQRSRSRSASTSRRMRSSVSSRSPRRSLSVSSSHSKERQRPQTGDFSAEMSNKQAGENMENQSDENGHKTPKASNRVMLTMEKLFGKTTGSDGKEGRAERDSKSTPTGIPDKRGIELGELDQTRRSSVSRIETWKEKARSTLKSATKEEDRERRRNSRRRLLESRVQTTESSAEELPPNFQVDESTDIPIEKAYDFARPYAFRTDDDSDESISDLGSLEKEPLTAEKPVAAGMSNSMSKVLNPQERRRRRATLGHDLLQRSLTALDSSNQLSSSLHSTVTMKGDNKSLLNMMGKKKEEVWQIRRRRHSLGKEDA